MFRLICLFILSTLYAKEYQCSLNLTPSDMTINASQASEYISTFSFDSQQSIGTQTTFKEIEVKLWMKDDMVITMIKDLKRKIAVTSKSSPSQDELYLKLSPDIVMQCLNPDVWNEKNEALLATMVPKITDSTNLAINRFNLIFTIKQNITFNYFQPNSHDKMRTIIFQNGKIIRDSNQKNDDQPWCAFQVEIKLTEDTIVEEGTRIKPVRTALLKNSKTHYVVSYSFVDFNKGTRTFQTSRFTPFSLECQLPVSTTFTYALFQQITGNYLRLEGAR